jgi:DNA-binding NtrC family response regulator
MIIGGRQTMQPYYLVMGVERGNSFNQFRPKSRLNKNFKIPYGFKILVVDDNRDFLEALSFTLKKKKIDVIAVESGYDAVKAVRNNGFDLILLDLAMPGMDGVETFKKINKIKNRYFVVLMTAYHEKEQMVDVKELGAFGFLKKPFEFDQLVQYIIKTKEEKNENGKNSYN